MQGLYRNNGHKLHHIEKAVAVNPTTCRIATFIATTRTLVLPSTIKGGVNVMPITIWRVSTKGVVTYCTASKSSSAAVCTMAVKWPTGGEPLTRKVGYNVICQHTT